MTIYKSKWYLGEKMTTGKRYIRQDLGAFPTYSSTDRVVFNWIPQPDGSLLGQRKPGCEHLFPHKGDHILKHPNVYRLTRALTVAEADNLTQEWVDANVDFNRASLSYSAYPRHHRWNELTDYTPEYEWSWDKVMGDVWALVELDVFDFKPGENDWKVALQYDSTRQYIEWFKQGHTPPPLFVVRHVDGDLVSLNRRRWLAAREAGIKSLLCYYSPSTAHGRPAWERKLCTWDHDTICTNRRAGGDCTDCPQRPEQFK